MYYYHGTYCMNFQVCIEVQALGQIYPLSTITWLYTACFSFLCDTNVYPITTTKGVHVSFFGHGYTVKIEVKITLYSSRVKLSDCYALGRLYTVTVESNVRMLVTTRLGLDSAPSIASCFLRASIGNMVYYSKGYTLTKTRNSHTICYRGQDNAEKFGIVLYFLSLTKGTVTIITPLSPTHHYPSPAGRAKEQDCARHGEFSHWCYTSSFIFVQVCVYYVMCSSLFTMRAKVAPRG